MARILVVAACISASTPLLAFIPSITSADAARALKIARSAPSERSAFDQAYVIDVNAPTVDLATVDRIEVITEFRRMEMIAAEHLGLNDTFGRGRAGEMLEAIRPWRNLVTIEVESRLDYARTLRSMPPPTEIAVDDHHPLKITTRTSGGGKAAPTRGIIEATFDSTTLASGVHSVTVTSSGRDVAHVNVDFGRFE